MIGYATFITKFPFRRLEELITYFVLGTILGCYLEIIWKSVRYHFTEPTYFMNHIFALPLAEPYGIGVLVVILVVYPLAQKWRLGNVQLYALNVIVTAIAEYLCAIALVITFGRNNFWDYSTQPFNLQGYICLETSLLFGLIAALFLRFLYSKIQYRFSRVTGMRMHIIAGLLLAVYLGLFFTFKRW